VGFEKSSGVDPGGKGGAIAPPPQPRGQYLFAPPKLSLNSKKLHQECTTNRHFEIQKIFTPPPSAPLAPRSPPKYIWIDAAEEKEGFKPGLKE